MNAAFRALRFTCKAATWDEVRTLDLLSATDLAAAAAATDLPIFEAESHPTRSWDEELPRYHVAVRPNGDRFLINTEGYDYARYAVKLPGKLCPSCMRSHECRENKILPIELNASNRCAACQSAHEEMS